MNTENATYDYFWERLDNFIKRTNLSPMFAAPLASMEECKSAYALARSLLDEEAEDQLVLYIGSCEEYCRTFALAAYEMGLEEARLKTTDAP